MGMSFKQPALPVFAGHPSGAHAIIPKDGATCSAAQPRPGFTAPGRYGAHLGICCGFPERLSLPLYRSYVAVWYINPTAKAWLAAYGWLSQS
jgi:hypothetical protein